MVMSRNKCLGLIVGMVSALGVSSSSWAQIPVGDTTTLTYTQGFDALANTGTTNTFSNNTTIVGLYSSQTVYEAGTGSSNAGKLYSFGATGSLERALGSVASGSAAPIYGFRFANTGTTDITDFTLAYTGEFWRRAGNTATQKLAFAYQVFASGGTITGTGYTPVTALDYSVTDPGGVLAGGTAPISTASISSTVTVTVPAGQEIWIRWSDADDGGADHGLAIDNVNASFTTAAAAIPEPTTLALLSLGVVGFVARRRKK
jgi:uncharacterized protein